MKNADTAMFHGKGIGKNTYQYFTSQMNIAVKRRMTLESALRRAVLQKDFVLHYQPQVNLETGEIVAVESLVRWKTEDSGTVMPGDFIPLAEETGLINEVGEWVLREACRQNKEWQDRGLAPRRMAVNLSARQFADKAFLDTVIRVLQDTGLDPKWLELEITESQVMRQTEGMILLLNRLSEMGVHLAIDDFGTGYSSLSYLKRLPIQKLKIDQSFIRDITVDPNDAAIVVAIINMARSLDLETIAEGVETQGQLALLRSKDCRVGQGFYFSAPLRAEGVYLLLQAEQPLRPRARARPQRPGANPPRREHQEDRRTPARGAQLAPPGRECVAVRILSALAVRSAATARRVSPAQLPRSSANRASLR
ncbi:MAG: EAL domain-containing protein [Betaproteobacteria bacterium]|nr:EAL domain-containing protein [Betaproteobacteria bacterium]